MHLHSTIINWAVQNVHVHVYIRTLKAICIIMSEYKCQPEICINQMSTASAAGNQQFTVTESATTVITSPATTLAAEHTLGMVQNQF